MIFKARIKVVAWLVSVLMLFAWGGSAGQMSSSTYKIPTDVADAAGQRGSSASYRMRDCVGQPSPVGTSHSSGFSISAGYAYIAFPLCGDCNEDNQINVGDLVCLINYLYRGGHSPCLPEGLDSNCDGVGNIADAVYLVNYLYRGGPPPCADMAATSTGTESKLYKKRPAAWVGLSSLAASKGDLLTVSVVGEFDVNLAAIELQIEYDPGNITVLDPKLTRKTEDLTVYSSADQGICKVGILDLTGEHYIPAGSGPLVNLTLKGLDLSSLKMARAILVDRDAQEIPVQILSQTKESEEDLITGGSAAPQEFSLSQNYPNPFNPETEITYALPNACHVNLSIYNVLGRRIRVLVDGYQATGHNSVNWDGTNEESKQVASGVYFYRIEAGEFVDTKRMILMK